jgi:aminoglycoside phosphotransferase family enzyme
MAQIPDGIAQVRTAATESAALEDSQQAHSAGAHSRNALLTVPDKLIKTIFPMSDIKAKLEFLRAPASYGDARQPVTCIETHMSWVFLLEREVFKLKKAVCFPFLDFTTLKARAFYCREEVRLNQRMAPDVYLGVMALQWHDGAFTLVPEVRLPAPGETVDWLVHMRRLPAERTLTHLISGGQLAPRDLAALGDLLAAFFQSAPAVAVCADDYLARFQYEQAATREVLLRPQFELQGAAQALERMAALLQQGAGLLRERANRQCVRDGHGDLRPEHVFLLQPPVVIDCLEFNPQLRQVDPFDELAFLGLECAMAGAPWIGPQLITGMATALRDPPHPALVPLYTVHRALLRARLAMAHLLDPQPRSPEKWTPLAQRYVAAALVGADRFTGAMQDGLR